MDDDYGDWIYEKRKDEKLDRMHDLLIENKRLREDQRRLEWVLHEWEHDFGENWREAIDAEMKESGDG